MRAFKGFLLVMLVLGVLGGAAFGVLWIKKQADAHSLDGVIIEPPPPQPEAPQEEEKIDPRLAGFLSRNDGARLLYPAEAGVKLLSVSFIDNGTLLLTTSTQKGKETRWSVVRLDLKSATPATILDGVVPRLTSSHRSAHRNAGRLCDAERDVKRGVYEIWCVDLDGKNAKQITTHDGKEDLMSPAISPDGAWIAFEVDADRPKPQGAAIWKVRLDGSDLQQLTRGANNRKPTWSDDGLKIYFQRRPVAAGASWDMYSMDADGKNSGPILRTYDEDELFPTRIASTSAFIVAEAASNTPARLKKIDSITKAGRYLTDGLSGPETSPSVSPDGALVAFLAPVSPDQPDALAIWLTEIEP